jgi:hypothetical protein
VFLHAEAAQAVVDQAGDGRGLDAFALDVAEDGDPFAVAERETVVELTGYERAVADGG